MNTQNNIGFMRLPQVLQLIPVGKSTWWEGVSTGRFPKPIKLGSRITVWKAQDIHNFIDNISDAQATKSVAS